MSSWRRDVAGVRNSGHRSRAIARVLEVAQGPDLIVRSPVHRDDALGGMVIQVVDQLVDDRAPLRLEFGRRSKAPLVGGADMEAGRHQHAATDAAPHVPARPTAAPKVTNSWKGYSIMMWCGPHAFLVIRSCTAIRSEDLRGGRGALVAWKGIRPGPPARRVARRLATTMPAKPRATRGSSGSRRPGSSWSPAGRDTRPLIVLA